AVLDLKTADVRSAIDAEKFKLTVEENAAKYKQLVAESALVDESQRAQIRANELNRDQSKIEVARAEANVKKMSVKAPMDGIVAMAKASTFRARYVGEIPVRIKLEKTDPRVIPDLTGSAEIILNAERNTMMAPRSAIFAEESGSFVFVQGSEGWVKKKVE